MKVIGYRQAHDSYTTADLDPAFVRVPFTLRRDDRFFIFGSCTARQMERALRLRGIDALSIPPETPPSEMMTGTSVVDRYRIPVIEQELGWALDGADFPADSLIDMPRGLCVDLQLPYSRSVQRDRALQRRGELNAYFTRACEATVFVIDLCLTDGFSIARPASRSTRRRRTGMPTVSPIASNIRSGSMRIAWRRCDGCARGCSASGPVGASC